MSAAGVSRIRRAATRVVAMERWGSEGVNRLIMEVRCARKRYVNRRYARCERCMSRASQ
ncbi:hypothetical protein BN2476_320298 [Paraburkholderia piptadeniae]|uniref:Uncharacterized protein n=1 Tax=Paraburkholderia piptadeniae TaxID=1701573 RepID=A0A1N7S5X8_9BURK|nr:hypothetical protein BN2476_320298 [Paraburkholderia piptadeniae]